MYRAGVLTDERLIGFIGRHRASAFRVYVLAVRMGEENGTEMEISSCPQPSKP